MLCRNFNKGKYGKVLFNAALLYCYVWLARVRTFPRNYQNFLVMAPNQKKIVATFLLGLSRKFDNIIFLMNKIFFLIIKHNNFLVIMAGETEKTQHTAAWQYFFLIFFNFQKVFQNFCLENNFREVILFPKESFGYTKYYKRKSIRRFYDTRCFLQPGILWPKIKNTSRLPGKFFAKCFGWFLSIYFAQIM